MGYKKGRVDVISMGCSKNLVDSERLLRRLQAKGYQSTHDSENPNGEWVVVNTCGFIGDAKEESINMILELAEAKNAGKIGNIAVMGCLSERYPNELKDEIPEVDRWYGKFNWTEFIDTLPDNHKSSSPLSQPKAWERNLTTPPWSAFLKISEGCNRFCAFCAIPIITGRHHSRPKEEILEEVRDLVNKGVVEFNVIAQDLSSYGKDLPAYGNGKSGLADLISDISDIPGVKWIRLHYAYPADFPLDILDVMREKDNVCKYLDIALQHISDTVLSNMRRHITREETLELLNTIRKKVPGIRIRTTLMTGFPGEGDREFDELLDFVKTQRFDRMGAFTYCEEDDTWGAKQFEDAIPQEIKQARLDKLMALQEDISLELNENLIGKKLTVLIERHEGKDSVGRTEYDSPDVDPEVIVKDVNLPIGKFAEVIITEAYPFELIGKPAKTL